MTYLFVYLIFIFLLFLVGSHWACRWLKKTWKFENFSVSCKHVTTEVRFLISIPLVCFNSRHQVCFHWIHLNHTYYSNTQGSDIRQIWGILCQNCSDDSTEVMERITSTPEIFSNKVNTVFVLIFFTTNTI